MKLRHLILAASALIFGVSGAFAANDDFVITTGPDGGPVFPEGMILPRNMTEAENLWLKSADGQAWRSDDDLAVSNVDILPSTDSGATWPTTSASANTGFDINDQDFTIQPAPSSVTDWANQ